MKRNLLLTLAAALLSVPAAIAVAATFAADPPVGYLFAYSTETNAGRNGLHFAWSMDGENWRTIGPEHSFLKCDYSRWGSEKRMVDPFLFRDGEGLWHCLWSLNESDGAFAHASSEDLIHWKRQSYPLMGTGNCLKLETLREETGQYTVSWISTTGSGETTWSVSTTDFRNYTPAKVDTRSRRNGRQDGRRVSVPISGRPETGTVHRVPRQTIDALIDAQKLSTYNALLFSETTAGDAERFASLGPLEATIRIDASNSKPISDMLMGVFFEDINYAADGGLYAELVQNRGFEYDPSDTGGRNRDWNNSYAWSVRGGTLVIDSLKPLHPNNPHYAAIESTDPGAVALVNEGFGGIVLKQGESYDFALFAKQTGGNPGALDIRLVGSGGETLAQASTESLSPEWKKYTATLTAAADAIDARLEVSPQFRGSVSLDMVSLFPRQTFKGRKNGLRADLAQAIADLKPRFVRFPGGCVAHGDGLENMYLWKNTVGPLEARKPQRNIWNYHQSAGLGFFEYFQFCEDIGAEPVPIVAAGVPCQNSAHHHHPLGGQQGGIPLEEMDEYIEDILDLIEWANGDRNSRWGRVRADAGHPEPFNLKYLGVGNEDQITDVFEERFTMICEALREKHPEITVIGTAGPFYEGTDYVEGWAVADRLDIPVVDEHYYNPPGWFIHNQDYYDKYDRSKSQVYLGEYAAHIAGRVSNVETALAEAIYLTALERNGDVVAMSSYAPLLAKEGNTQWNPDLIYFNNTEVKPTVGYHVQKLWGNHSGHRYLTNTVTLSEKRDAVTRRVACSVVADTVAGEIVIKLVNLLPVAVKGEFDVGGTAVPTQKAALTLLGGDPSDRNVRPVESSLEAGSRFGYDLPPYSLSVIRLKTAARGTPLEITRPAARPETTFNMGTASRPDGTTITMDSQALLVDGKPVLPVMGEIHFSRVPQQEWRHELLKMKAGGINIVATYLFWLHHEEIEGQYDWTGQRDLGRFVELCGELGLPLVLRIGPWCHGEARHGGFPLWLVESGIPLRSNDAAYLAKVRGWYGAIFDQVEGRMWKDGGPVIGVQLDNEYGGPWEHLMTLKTIARQTGFDVPLYTRTGWPALRTPATFGEIVPLYGDYADGFWDRSLNEMPGDYSKVYLFRAFRNSTVIATEQLPPQAGTDRPEDLVYPYFTCELGGGMMTSYHRRINIAPMDIYAMALIKVASGSNLPGYYMYHGGTNPEGRLSYLNEEQATAYTNHNDLPVKTYDFQTALGEFGNVNPQYHLLRRMHLFLADFGPELARMDPFFPADAPVDPQDDRTLRWNARSDGQSGYVFVNNYQRLKVLSPKEGVQFSLNLPEGALEFPRQPLTVPSGAAFFMPFKMKIGDAQLIWATAQPVARIEEEGVQTLFFAEIPGIPAEFAWKNDVRVDRSSRAPRLEDGALCFSGLPTGPDEAFSLFDSAGRRIRVVLLSERESLGLWKGEWAGRERVFLTENLFTTDGREVTLEEEVGEGFELSVFPAPRALDRAGEPVNGSVSGLFTRYRIDAEPPTQATVRLEKRREAGPLRQIETGPRGVAERPDDAAFAAAAEWKLSLELPEARRDRDIRLHIPYTGDAARVYLDGKLLTDNFYNGKPLLLGLKRYAPAVYEGELTIRILPFQKGAPIYLQRGNEIDFRGADSAVELREVTAFETRRITLTAE
jgi:alpha-L-arabinofuranosidase